MNATDAAQDAVHITARPLAAADFWPIHSLLVETTPIAPVGLNWDIRRWEGRRFYDPRPGGDPAWCRHGRVWQTAAGQIVAAAHGDGPGYPALQIHPDYRYLENDMVAWAEAHLAAPGDDGRRIHLLAYHYDVHRRQLLSARGYEETTSGGVIRRLRLGPRPRPEPTLAAGYSLRTSHAEDDRDAERIADLLNAAFGRTFHNAAEYRQFTRQAPSYRPELDLVAVAPDGAFAAYVGIPYDEANRLGIFEPVCTHPDHRRQGLARALMQAGLQRLRALGARVATVETGDMVPANRLYAGLGFTECYTGTFWRRNIKD